MVEAVVGIKISIPIFGWSAFGAHVAFKKGYRILGIAIISIAIILIGLLLSILAFVKPYKDEEREPWSL